MKGLIQLGHRRIAYLHTSPPVTAHKERLLGYREALEEAGLFREELIPPCSNTRASLEAAISFLLDLPEPPTAFFCRNHGTLVTVFGILLGKGYRIPQDFSLVCFDRPDEALDILLPASYVHQPAEEIAVSAVRLLLNRAENPRHPAEPKIVTLAPKVIWRASCAPPRARP
ncbi:MAG: LacI family DNA-binding transcriptional regulator [Clostridia bacterium]